MAVVKKEDTSKQVNDKMKAVDLAISYLDKQFGKGTLMRLGEKTAIPVEAISTGSLSVDMAIGVGGFPKGRIIEIYGPESSGKTTFALSVIAECQKTGGTCAFIDAEHALDVIYARKLGVDIGNLLIAQPDNGEQALEIADTLIRSGGVDVIVIDSVAALVPKQELEGDMDQVTVGMQARLMSRSLRKLTAGVSKSGTVLIFINQLRMKIGGYGNPETTTGGVALKFYSSVRMEVRPSGGIIKGEDRIGANVKIKIVKNKVAAPFKQVEVCILFGQGIDKIGELVTLGEKAGIFAKSGSWYSYNGEKIGQGRDNVKQYLLDHPDLIESIKRKILESSGVLNFDGENIDTSSSEISESLGE